MAYRNYSTAISHIVDPNGFGDFTTIGAALSAATAGSTIFIRPGTYTENPTLVAGVNLSAFPCDSGQKAGVANVIILGKCTASYSGSCEISGIQLETNSDFCLVISGSNSTNVTLNNCFINASNNTAISYTSSVNSKVILNQCNGDLVTTGIAYFSHSSAGQLIFNGGYYQNNGGSSTSSTNSGSVGGTVNFFNVGYFNNGYTSSNTNTTTTATNSVFLRPLILNGSADSISFCGISGGSSSAISVSSGGVLSISNSSISSSNTNAITGAGTIQYSLLAFTGSSSTINTTTQTILLASSFQKVNIQTFTSSGTYTPTAGMKYCIVESVGSGGAGGGAAATGAATAAVGSGGSGGAYTKLHVLASTVGTSQTITIGAGGSPGSAGAVNGGNGNTTSFGAILTAAGGNGGTGGSAASTVVTGAPGGGSASGGDVNINGGPGGVGFGLGALQVIVSGFGGGSSIAQGASPPVGTSNGSACPNSRPGGGGSGGSSTNSGGAVTGGSGANGIVIVTEFI